MRIFTARRLLVAALMASAAVPAMADSYFFRTKPDVSSPQRAFSFAPATAANPGDTVVSAATQVRGYRNKAASVSGGAGAAYQICAASDCSDQTSWRTGPTSGLPDAFYARLAVTAGAFGTERLATLAVGDASASFSATARAKDATPDGPISFAAQTNVAASTAVTSNRVALTGHDGIAVSVTGAGSPSYRICSDASCSSNPNFVAGSTVTDIPADTPATRSFVELRMISGATGSAAQVATLAAGTATASWSVTASAAAPTSGTTCKAIYDAGQRTSGMYAIDPDGSGPNQPFQAYCDMTTDGGGWTLISWGGDTTNEGPLYPNQVIGNAQNRATPGSIDAGTVIRASTCLMKATHSANATVNGDASNYTYVAKHCGSAWSGVQLAAVNAQASCTTSGQIASTQTGIKNVATVNNTFYVSPNLMYSGWQVNVGSGWWVTAEGSQACSGSGIAGSTYTHTISGQYCGGDCGHISVGTAALWAR